MPPIDFMKLTRQVWSSDTTSQKETLGQTTKMMRASSSENAEWKKIFVVDHLVKDGEL